MTFLPSLRRAVCAGAFLLGLNTLPAHAATFIVLNLNDSGTLTLAPGQTGQTITVCIKGVTVVEGDEKFLVRLLAPVNARFAKAVGTGTIINDDNVSAADASASSSSNQS